MNEEMVIKFIISAITYFVIIIIVIKSHLLFRMDYFANFPSILFYAQVQTLILSSSDVFHLFDCVNHDSMIYMILLVTVFLASLAATRIPSWIIKCLVRLPLLSLSYFGMNELISQLQMFHRLIFHLLYCESAAYSYVAAVQKNFQTQLSSQAQKRLLQMIIAKISWKLMYSNWVSSIFQLQLENSPFFSQYLLYLLIIYQFQVYYLLYLNLIATFKEKSLVAISSQQNWIFEVNFSI